MSYLEGDSYSSLLLPVNCLMIQKTSCCCCVVKDVHLNQNPMGELTALLTEKDQCH